MRSIHRNDRLRSRSEDDSCNDSAVGMFDQASVIRLEVNVSEISANFDSRDYNEWYSRMIS